jgi:hypothetical protein
MQNPKKPTVPPARPSREEFKALGTSMDLAVFSTGQIRRIVALLQELDAGIRDVPGASAGALLELAQFEKWLQGAAAWHRVLHGPWTPQTAAEATGELGPDPSLAAGTSLPPTE